LLAALASVLPLAILSIQFHVLREAPPTLGLLLFVPLVAGGGLTLWILFLHLYVCGDGLDQLGFRASRLWLDIVIGALGGVTLLAFQLFIWNATVARLFPPNPPAEEVIELIAGVARNPWLLALLLGPVVWIGVALFEELMRAFLLRRLWQVWRGPVGRAAAVGVVSALMGVAHAYQGPSAVLSLGLQSLLLGWFYMRTGRIRALIVAHGVFDSIQIILGVIALRQMGP
jgi:membrane protease YdiL (CAAX protease family)